MRFNGIVYERLMASLQRRPRYDIHHSAVESGAGDSDEETEIRRLLGLVV